MAQPFGIRKCVHGTADHVMPTQAGQRSVPTHWKLGVPGDLIGRRVFGASTVLGRHPRPCLS